MANGEITGPPAVNFYSMLSGLGDTIQANRTAQAKRDALAAATQPGADGTVDYGRAMLGLAGVDPQAASLFAQAQSHKDQLAQQKIANDRAVAESDRAQRNADRSYGLQLRTANRADDPTPTNFVKDPTAPGGYRPIGPADPAYLEQVAAAKARAAALTPPDGFSRGPDGSLIPMPGGPTDPNYLARVDAEKARAKGDVPTVMGAGSSVIIPNKAADGPLYSNKPTAGGLSPDALAIKAHQWNQGDYEGATKNVGRGAQGSATLEAIANKAAEMLIAEGKTPEEAAAATSQSMQKFKAAGIYQNTESRTGASREANLNIILKAADAAIPAALEASDKVSRTGFVPLNKVIQAGKIATSDPDLRAFGMANLQLAEHWARAMNPTGVMRESDRDMALHFLSLADTKDTYKSSVMQLKTQITRERDAIRGSTPGHGGGTPAAPAAGAYVWTPDSGLVSK
jgi:hypothetical protein